MVVMVVMPSATPFPMKMMIGMMMKPHHSRYPFSIKNKSNEENVMKKYAIQILKAVFLGMFMVACSNERRDDVTFQSTTPNETSSVVAHNHLTL